MKKLYLLSLGLMFQSCVLAANPNFYVLYIRNDNNAMIHSTDKKIGRVQELPMTVPPVIMWDLFMGDQEKTGYVC